jgi:Rod binding domain-containing protein
MDSSNIIDSAVSSVGSQQINKPIDKTDAAKLQFAKDFEGIFINKLLEEMKNTIGQWGDEKDGAAQQIDGIFWMHLGKDLGDKGGIGMWKDIYKSLTPNENTNTAQSLDKQL